MTKLLGYQKGVSKKTGTAYCRLHVVSDLSDFEKNQGGVGQKVSVEFAPSDQIDMFKPEHIGREILFNYTISGGRAFLQSVTIK